MKLYLFQEEIEDGFQGSSKETISLHRTKEGAEAAMKQRLDDDRNEWAASAYGKNREYRQRHFYCIGELEVLD